MRARPWLDQAAKTMASAPLRPAATPQKRAPASLVTTQHAMDYFELQAMDSFRRHVLAQRTVIRGLMAECDTRIEQQRAKVTEARRKAELLNKLKDRKWKAWNAELAKEIENQAGEIFLAKWSAERRRALSPPVRGADGPPPPTAH